MAVGRVEALCNRIEEELRGHVSSDSLSCSIFRVPNHLRKVNEMAYEPQVISIGPYHRGKDHLKAMEVHKKHYLKMLLDRNKEKTLKEYVETLEGLQEEALKFYSEPPSQRDGEDQFVEMMLFDGCFVVELIRKSAMEELREEKDYLLTHFLLRTVLRDLLLIENQLPFSILSKLFDMIKMPDEANQDFMQMAIDCFSIMMPGPCYKDIGNHPGINHLLGLLHYSCVSPDYRKFSEGDERPPPVPSVLRVEFPPIKTLMEEKPSASRVEFRPMEAKKEKPSASRVEFPPMEAKIEELSALRVEFPPMEAKKEEEEKGSKKSGVFVKFLPIKTPVKEKAPVPSAPPVAFPAIKTPIEEKPPPPPPSAPRVAFPPIKTPMTEKYLPFNTVPMIPQHSEIKAEPVGVVASKPRMDVRSFLSSDEDHRDFSVATDAPVVTVPPSKTSDGVNSLPSGTTLTNIHHPEMEAESERSGPESESSAVEYEGHEGNNCNWQTIRSASELHEAGIKFENKITGRLFDIKFEKGVMSIPTLKIGDDTESILRNFVAYEQCYKDISSRHFTDYIRFMDCLINTEKDVELLRHHEVIENRLGDDEVIADIFNRICDSVLIAEEEFFYADLFVKVHKHCKRKWNLWKANLWHNYFNTPWALISFLAAVFLLLLTAMQSIYSALAYHDQH